MRTALAISAGLLLATVAACGAAPPPPELTVTSPQRGLVQGSGTQLQVTGTALPNTLGTTISKVTINGTAATLNPDGSFVATINAPQGPMLLQTVATASDGGTATDARAVETGTLSPVGSSIPRAVTAALPASAFTQLAAAAGPIISGLNIGQLLAPYQPMVTEGDSIANFKMSIGNITFTNPKITLAPVAGGLAFTAAFSGLAVAATVTYGGSLLPSGTSPVNITADTVSIGGTLAITPAGTAGFTTSLTSPTVNTTGLKLTSTGITGDILDLINSTLGSSFQSIITTAAEAELAPMINQAMGALSGPQTFDVLGQKLDIQASPSAVTFSSAGALVTMDLKVLIEGAESSPGFITTDNTAPAMDDSHGFQLGLAEDLVNELLAQIQTLGLLDLSLQQDFDIIDSMQLQLSMPPMVSANNADGTLRLIIGDMVATFGDKGKTVAKAAINAQIDVKLAPADADDVELQFGNVDLQVNLLDGTGIPGLGSDDLTGAASSGLSLQLGSLSKLLIKLPVPAIDGIQLENVSVDAANGYIVMSGDIQ